MQPVGKKSETLPGICGDAAIPIRSSKMELSQRKGKSDKLPLLAKVTKSENNAGKKKIKKLTLSSCFKYKIHSGNNCRLIMLALKKRPWFHAVNDSDKEEADDVVNSLSLIWEMYRNPNKYKTNRYFHVLYNHLENNAVLTTKKGLYESIRAYCQEHTDVDILDIIPRTFYLCAGTGSGAGVPAGEGSISACSSTDDAAAAETSTSSSAPKKTIAQDDMQQWLEFNRTFTRKQALVPTTPPLTATAAAPATEAIVVAPVEAETTTSVDTVQQPAEVVNVDDKAVQGGVGDRAKLQVISDDAEAGARVVVEEATDVPDNNSSSSAAVSPRLDTVQVKETTEKAVEVATINVVDLTPSAEPGMGPTPPLSSTLQLPPDDSSLEGTGTLPSAASTDAIVAMPPPAAVVAGPVDSSVPTQVVAGAPKPAGVAEGVDPAPVSKQPSLRKRRLQAASTAAAATDNEACVWIMKPASLTNRGFGIKVVRGVDPVLEMVNCSVPSTPEEERDPPTPTNGSGSSNNSFAGSFANGSAGSSSGSAKRSPSVAGNTSSSNSNGGGGGGSTRMKPTQGSLERGAAKRAKQTGWIVQEYMERPLLIHGRKFDIRCYVVVTHTILGGSKLKAYFYQDAYVRTSCKKYNLSRLDDRETHLTNDAVQKNSKNYGKYEQGNKLSLSEWQQTIIEDYPGASPTIVMDSIFPKIKQLTAVSLAACKNHLCASTFPRSFELFGYDYMVDEDFKPTLIEVNSNPCLETSAPLLADMIPRLIDNVISICVDPVYQPQPLSVSYPSSSSGSSGNSTSVGRSSSTSSNDDPPSSRAGTPTYTPMTEEALKSIAAEENRFEELILPS